MSKKALTIAILYTLIAGMSTAINICAQMVSMAVYHATFAIEISILFGTAAGMPLRYLLEKRYIFSFKSNNVAHDGQLFVLYSVMGVFTTIIFWGTEYAFQHIFATDTMRYVGGVVGLAIGFFVKYQLDKKFVFVGGCQ